MKLRQAVYKTAGVIVCFKQQTFALKEGCLPRYCVRCIYYLTAVKLAYEQ